MAGCKPTPEFEDAIRKMARNRYANGITDRAHIIDSIHEAVGDIGAWRNEIGDIVHAEVGEQLTLAEVRARLSNTKNEIRKLANTQQNATRRAQLEKKMADLKRRIETRDYAKTPRTRYEYSPEVRAIDANIERMKQAMDHDIQQMSYSRRSKTFKVMKRTTDIMRSLILTGPAIFAKLVGATGGRVVSTVLEDLAGSALQHIPAYRRISELAPTEGGGFMAGVQADALRSIPTKETAKAFKDKIAKGASDRQAVYGDGHVTSHWFDTLLSLPGRSHDAFKTGAEQYGYYRSIGRQTENMRAALKRTGHSDEAIDKVMATDSVIAAIQARAYGDSKAAKLMGDNKFVDAYNAELRKMEKSGDIWAMAAFLLKQEAPIVRIPANYVGEATSYIPGGGLLKAYSRNNAAKLRGGLTPDDADYIARALKKQSVGAVAVSLGWVYADQLGGIYRPMRGESNKDVHTGDIKVSDNFTMTHQWLHGPLAEAMQASALAKHVFMDELKKTHDDSKSGLAKAFGTGATTALAALAQSVPILTQAPKDLLDIAQGRGGKVLGEKVAQNTIPGAVGWYARHEDVDANGEPIKRKAGTFETEIMSQIPGYREELRQRK